MRDRKRHLIARRAAQEIKDGFYVNLSLGIPALVASHLPDGVEAMLLSESGVLGFRARPQENEIDPDLTNAAKEAVTIRPGASFFSCADAYAMIRGGHLDLCILGGLEVDEAGNLANWMIPGKMVKGMGGAMDLASGARRVVVAMEHTTRNRKPRIVRNCTLPLTGLSVVHRIITEMAVIDVTPQGLLLREVASELSVDEVCRATEASLRVDKDLKIIQL
ncbi:MAG TPA: 3-oxoacid CoA-transferase subunit B [Terriglobia bacterium]|jgi:3-oxoacid CoA-transferase subunit B|nr:3-oxoacid CoA-transferase subunit B [Terriglobia bacterium]